MGCDLECCCSEGVYGDAVAGGDFYGQELLFLQSQFPPISQRAGALGHRLSVEDEAVPCFALLLLFSRTALDSGFFCILWAAVP